MTNPKLCTTPDSNSCGPIEIEYSNFPKTPLHGNVICLVMSNSQNYGASTKNLLMLAHRGNSFEHHKDGSNVLSFLVIKIMTDALSFI